MSAIKNAAKLLKVSVNGIRVKVTDGSTLLDAVRAAKVHVPTLCFHPRYEAKAVCRLCLVKVDGGNLEPACATPARDGVRVETDSERLQSFREGTLQYLLSRHPNANISYPAQRSECMRCEVNGKCKLQSLIFQEGVEERWPYRERGDRVKHPEHRLHDHTSPSIQRDLDKCVECGLCAQACGAEGQNLNVIGFAERSASVLPVTVFDKPLSETECISCGQCTLVCPVGALVEKPAWHDVMHVLDSNRRKSVVQVAPASRVAISEEFGLTPGTVSTGRLVNALRAVGFTYVFDTNFAADLTIMEEANELLQRITSGDEEHLPLFTSCCPGWINYVELQRPDLLPHLSTTKSPQQMHGALTKRGPFADLVGEEPYVVSVMPCTAKKDEAKRPGGSGDVDEVLTTRELARLFRARNVDFASLPNDGEFDDPLGASTGAAQIFGASGGVMEAALRTATVKLGLDAPIEFEQKLRGVHGGLKVAHVDGVGDVAAVNGMTAVQKLLEGDEWRRFRMIEVMACAGGCIGGGGEPKSDDADILSKRAAGVYSIDERATKRYSHENESVLELYSTFLGEPLSELSEKLLHTTYAARKTLRSLLVRFLDCVDRRDGDGAALLFESDGEWNTSTDAFGTIRGSSAIALFIKERLPPNPRVTARHRMVHPVDGLDVLMPTGEQLNDIKASTSANVSSTGATVASNDGYYYNLSELSTSNVSNFDVIPFHEAGYDVLLDVESWVEPDIVIDRLRDSSSAITVDAWRTPPVPTDKDTLETLEAYEAIPEERINAQESKSRTLLTKSTEGMKYYDANDFDTFDTKEETEKVIPWTSLFQAYLSLVPMSKKEGKRRVLLVNRLIELFTREALPIVKTIVTELHLSADRRQYQPLKGAFGVAGGAKFLVKNMFFKVATQSNHALYVNDDNAAKSAANELRAAREIIAANVADLHVPLMILVHYAGHAVLVESVLPISGDASLCYGSSNGGRTITQSDETCREAMQQLGAAMNLSEHEVGEVKLTGPLDIEVHCSQIDGRYYVIDLARLFPSEKSGKSWLWRCLRPELVRVTPRPVNSDTYSRFRFVTAYTDEDELQVDEARSQMLNVLVPDFVRQHARATLEEALATLADSVSLDGGTEALWDTETCFAKGVISIALHRIGVNVRHLATLYSLCHSDALRVGLAQLALLEMVARAIKLVWRREMREQLRAHVDRQERAPSDTQLQMMAVKSFLDACTVSEQRFETKILPLLQEMFDWEVVHDSESVLAQVRAPDMDTRARRLLIRRCMNLTGVLHTTETCENVRLCDIAPAHRMRITLEIGNRATGIGPRDENHELIEVHRWRWQAEVRLLGSESASSSVADGSAPTTLTALDEIVERVEFHLHHTFRPFSSKVAKMRSSTADVVEGVLHEQGAAGAARDRTEQPYIVSVERAPFLVERIGWGVFVVRIMVFFKPHTGLAPLDVEHMLTFERGGAFARHEIVLDRRRIARFVDLLPSVVTEVDLGAWRVRCVVKTQSVPNEMSVEQRERQLANQTLRLGPSHPQLIGAMKNLTVARLAASDQKAIESARDAVRLAAEVYGETHTVAIDALHLLGNVLYWQASYTEALQTWQRVFSLIETSGARGNVRHWSLEMALALTDCGNALQRLGRPSDALDEYRRALAMFEEHSGTSSRYCATLHNNIGSCLEALHRFDEAMLEYRHSLSIKTRLLGNSHPSVAATLENMASIYEHQNRLEESRRMLEHVLGVLMKAFGANHASLSATHNNLGALLVRMNDLEGARHHFMRSLELKQMSLGAAHPEVSDCYFNLAHVSHAHNEHDMAAELMRTAVRLRVGALGDAHVDTLEALNNLGYFLELSSRADEARLFYERVLAALAGDSGRRVDVELCAELDVCDYEWSVRLAAARACQNLVDLLRDDESALKEAVSNTMKSLLK